jgi:hypothetical protein
MGDVWTTYFFLGKMQPDHLFKEISGTFATECGEIGLKYTGTDTIDDGTGKVVSSVFHQWRSSKHTWIFDHDTIEHPQYPPTDPSTDFPYVNSFRFGFGFDHWFDNMSTTEPDKLKNGMPIIIGRYTWRGTHTNVVFPIWLVVAMTATIPGLYWHRRIRRRRMAERGFSIDKGDEN